MRNRIIFSIFAFALVAAPFSAQARFFDHNDIFTDAELSDANALSRTAIQNFLEAKNSVLKNVVDIANGVPRLVSEMIYEIGQANGISQKFLLAKLQHEQGLIEKSTASQTALDWATGYSCFNNRCNDKYRGIYNQLDAAASVQKIYIERSRNSGYFGYEVGRESKTSDGFIVKPANQATANLYIYTPYRGGETGIGGNYAFWRVWNRYFTERTFADGALLKDELTGEYWRIENGKRRKFASAALYLQDHREADAIPVAHERLSYYREGEKIEFGNNALVKAAGSGLTYLLSNGQRHRVAGPSALAALGYRLANTTPVTPVILPDAEIDKYIEGEPITENTQYPKGVLLRDETGGIFWVKAGARYPLVDEAVWQENFARQTPIGVSTSVLAAYILGEPLKLNDGSLVKDSGNNYYVIATGDKHQFSSPEIARRVFGDNVFANVPTASAALLAMHSRGDQIDYIDDTIQDPANYVSYAERTGAAPVPAPNQTLAASTLQYLALYDSLALPASVMSGVNAGIKVSFRNRGASVWRPGEVFLKLIDENSSVSTLRADNRVSLASVVETNSLAVFEFDITGSKPGLISEWFILEYKNANGNYVEMPGGLVGGRVTVGSGVSAQVLSHNIPVAVRNKWSPIKIAVKIKNTSQTEVWTARKTAFILKAENGADSPFYDKADWLDKEVAGVPVNRSTIAPGQEGIVYFTLDPRGVKAGTYKLVFSMALRDKNEKVFLNGDTWERAIRVDN